MLRSIGLPELVVILILAGIIAWPFCRISKRLGYHALFGLLSIIPFVGVFLWAYVVAFSRWPITSSPGTQI